jgi:hypothetical protein
LAPDAKKVITDPLPHFHEPTTNYDESNEVKTPVIEHPKATVKKAFKPISIKINAAEETEKPLDEVVFETETKPNDFISDELFKEVWASLAATYQDQSLNLYAALTTYKSTIDKNLNITLAVDNAIQENLILEKKSEILAFLRKMLNNYFVKLETRLIENEKRKKPLDPKEKLEKLNKKNPQVKTLCNELGLDPFY